MLQHSRPGRGPLRELGWGFGGEAGLGEKGHIQGEAWGLGEKLERGYSGGTVGSSQAPRSVDSAAAMGSQTCR